MQLRGTVTKLAPCSQVVLRRPTPRGPTGLRQRLQAAAAAVLEAPPALNADFDAASGVFSLVHLPALIAQEQQLDGSFDCPLSRDEALFVLDSLQRDIAVQGTHQGLNVLAVSGSPASTLAAWVLTSVFEDTTVACMVTDGVPEQQLQAARMMADLVGLQLWEISAAEMAAADGGQLVLGDPLAAVAQAVQQAVSSDTELRLFSGMAGSGSAQQFGDASSGFLRPLAQLSASMVDALLQELGLCEMVGSRLYSNGGLQAAEALA